MHTETKLKLSAVHNMGTEQSDCYIHNEHQLLPVAITVYNISGREITDIVADKVVRSWNLHDELVEAVKDLLSVMSEMKFGSQAVADKVHGAESRANALLQQAKL